MRNRRFDFIVTCVCISLLGYFAWHAWKGQRGYPYRDQLATEEAALEAKYQTIEGQRLALEHRVSLLRPESIDPDMLDELARSELEMASPSEVVVIQNGQIPQGNP